MCDSSMNSSKPMQDNQPHEPVQTSAHMQTKDGLPLSGGFDCQTPSFPQNEHSSKDASTENNDFLPLNISPSNTGSGIPGYQSKYHGVSNAILEAAVNGEYVHLFFHRITQVSLYQT